MEEDDSHDELGSSESGDDAVEQVFQALHKKREDWLVDAKPAGTDFRTAILGGAWTQRTLGKAFDVCIGKARA